MADDAGAGQQAPPPLAQPPTPSAPSTEDRGIAVGALVLAVLPLVGGWIASVVLALLVLRHRRPGRGLALTALGVVACWLSLLTVGGTAALLVYSTHHHGSSEPAAVASPRGNPSGGADDQATDGPTPHARNGDVNVYDLRVGDCVRTEIPDHDVDTVPVVPCTRPHREEVYAVFQLDIDPPARQREVDRLADGGCTRRFADFVGTPYSQSDLEISWFSPDAGSLKVDHSVQCLVEPPSGQVTGTLKAPQS